MAYVIFTPAQNQSPGIFPAQNNENFQRLKDIINADHNFTDTSSAAQGIHKQCGMINKTIRVVGEVIPGNGELYAAADSSGQSQLNWYNESNNFQITPGVLQIASSAAVARGASTVMFADPGFSYQAYVWVSFSAIGLGRTGIAVNDKDNSGLVDMAAGGSAIVSYSGHNLIVTNTATAPGSDTIYWTLLITRVL